MKGLILLAMPAGAAADMGAVADGATFIRRSAAGDGLPVTVINYTHLPVHMRRQ